MKELNKTWTEQYFKFKRGHMCLCNSSAMLYFDQNKVTTLYTYIIQLEIITRNSISANSFFLADCVREGVFLQKENMDRYDVCAFCIA